MEQPAAGNVGHEPRRGGGEAGPVDAFGDIIEHLGRVAAAFRELGLERLGEHLRPRAVAGRVFDLVEIGQRMVERPAAELAPLGPSGSSGDAASRSALDALPQLAEHQPPISRAASSA